MPDTQLYPFRYIIVISATAHDRNRVFVNNTSLYLSATDSIHDA
jgi:hypothetical protein